MKPKPDWKAMWRDEVDQNARLRITLKTMSAPKCDKPHWVPWFLLFLSLGVTGYLQERPKVVPPVPAVAHHKVRHFAQKPSAYPIVNMAPEQRPSVKEPDKMSGGCPSGTVAVGDACAALEGGPSPIYKAPSEDEGSAIPNSGVPER